MLLNFDAGEHDDEPEALWNLADILAVACGGHAGDATSMSRLATFCATGRPGLGAHPSYPDREGFGRRTIAIAPAALAASIEAQCAALAHAAHEKGTSVRWVKPHGALYHDANRDRALADALLDGALAALGSSFHILDQVRRAFRDEEANDPGDARSSDERARRTSAAEDSRSALASTHGPLTVIGPPRGCLFDAASDRGLAYLREGFADRGVRPDGSLIPRGEPGALITDPALAVARVRALVGQVDTICVHADTPDALVVARAVREALDA